MPRPSVAVGVHAGVVGEVAQQQLHRPFLQAQRERVGLFAAHQVAGAGQREIALVQHAGDDHRGQRDDQHRGQQRDAALAIRLMAHRRRRGRRSASSTTRRISP